ncbi:MAG: DUF1501 domain-containing protein [Ilumatobacteraceae bacterium]|jgi:uncharacterized protein (DUF1501 family)
MSDPTAHDAYRRLSIPGESTGVGIELSRRRFLQALAAGVGSSTLMGMPWVDRALASSGVAPLAASDRILVLVGMYGGNDGLNTVIPYADPDYARRRGAVAIPASTVNVIDASVGLHPELKTVKKMYDAKQVAIVAGVGYKPADFSHFSSMALWMKGGAPTVAPGSGWIGRWLDEKSSNVFTAVTVGQSVGLHLVGRSQQAVAVGSSGPTFGYSTDPATQANVERLRAFASTSVGGWYDMIARTIGKQLDVAQVVGPIQAAVPESTAGSSEILAKMGTAARLINANIGCRVLDVAWGSFDTHANEIADHGTKMKQFDEALAAFYSVLDPAIAPRVVVMTWSEFGRTLTATASAGTDHGSSSSLFVIGAPVKGGRYGQMPPISGTADRPDATVDFRSVYSTVLDGTLGAGSSSVLGATYENLGFLV